MKKKAIWLVSILVAALMLSIYGAAPAAEKPKPGGTLVAASSVDTSSLDPAYSTSGADMRFETLAYDPFVHPSTDYKPRPEMSPVSWEVPNPNKIIFRIKKGVRFHDGTAYDAAAVKFNLDRMMEKGCPRKGYFHNVGSVDIIDGSTVAMNFKKPDAIMLANLGYWAGFFSSPAQVKKWGDEYALHPTGSGPFKITDIKRGVQYTYERFKDYWNTGYPYIDKIILKVIPDDTVRFAALRAGETDVLFGARPRDQARVKKTKKFQLVQGGGGACYILPHNLKEPFTDKRVRMAMAFAIDRKTMNETLSYGLGFIHTQPLPPSIWGYDKSLESFSKQYGFAYNPEKSKQLLKEAGYPNGIKFSAIVYSSEPLVARAEAVKGYFAEVGIDMKLEVLDIGALAGRQTKGEYHALISTWTPPRDPSTQLFLMNHSTGGPWQGGRWKDKKYDDLVEKAGQIFDTAERRKLYTEAQKIMIENCYDVYLVSTYSTDLVSPKVKGYKLWATGYWYPQETWIEQ